MKKNSDTFLDSFTDIERHLRSLGNANRSTRFYQLVDTAARNDRVVARYSSDLKEYADLRNAIVHERSDGHVIAEPNDRAVADLLQLSTLLLNPPKVLPMFQTRVETRETSSPVGEAVQVMYRQSFSQLPVVSSGQVVGVLTANTIARWLGHEVSTDIFILSETTIEQVFAYTEDPENHCFLHRSSSLFDVLDCFERFDSQGKDLDAILLTERGRSSESLLSILTLYDLPRILASLKLKGLRAA